MQPPLSMLLLELFVNNDDIIQLYISLKYNYNGMYNSFGDSLITLMK